MYTDLKDREVEDVPQTRWTRHLPWATLAMAGLLVFEFTREPALAAAVICAKFGWNDLRTAFWIRRVDPRPERGRTCFWFFLAAGLWRIVVSALIALVIVLFLAIIVLSFVVALRQANPWQVAQPFDRMAFAAMVEAYVGLWLAVVVSYIGLGCALRRRVKVWVDPQVHQSRREAIWPPIYWGRNRAGRLVNLATLLTFFLIMFGLAAGTMAARLPPIIVFVAFLVLPIALTPVARAVRKRIVARTPWECWSMQEYYEGGEPVLVQSFDRVS